MVVVNYSDHMSRIPAAGALLCSAHTAQTTPQPRGSWLTVVIAEDGDSSSVINIEQTLLSLYDHGPPSCRLSGAGGMTSQRQSELLGIKGVSSTTWSGRCTSMLLYSPNEFERIITPASIHARARVALALALALALAGYTHIDGLPSENTAGLNSQ